MGYPPKPLTTYEALFRFRSALFMLVAEILRATPMRSLKGLADTVTWFAVKDDIIADKFRDELLDNPRQG